MKIFPRILLSRIAVVAFVMCLSLNLRAEHPREELIHAFRLLKTADHDYAGHRIKAMRQIETAGAELGLVLRGDLIVGERQWKSDAQLAEARRLLVHARDQLEARDRDRVAARLQIAIEEINLALGASPALPVRVESPREELVHAFRLLKTADHDYAGHRAKAMRQIETAGAELGLVLRGDLIVGERQWKSDAQLSEARRLLAHARDQLEARDRDRVAARLQIAIEEINQALAVR